MAATEVNVGVTCKALKAKSGNSSKGDWELLVVGNENGKNEVNIWVNNRPSGVPVNGMFTVTKITGVKFGYKKREWQGQDKFEPKIDINADVKFVESGFESIPDAFGDNPFDDVPDLPL